MTAPRFDVFDADKRAAVMRAVKSRDTKPELKVRAAVRALGAGYRLGGWGLSGRPDLVFPGRRKAIFVHGCFWHGHGCRRGARAPKDNVAYWTAKIARNRTRDAESVAALSAAGWSALTIWECELRDAPALSAKLGSFLA